MAVDVANCAAVTAFPTPTLPNCPCVHCFSLLRHALVASMLLLLHAFTLFCLAVVTRAGPLTAVIDAQGIAAMSTVDFINKVGFDENGTAVTIAFTYNTTNSTTGLTQTNRIEVPFLTILPIPFLRVSRFPLQNCYGYVLVCWAASLRGSVRAFSDRRVHHRIQRQDQQRAVVVLRVLQHEDHGDVAKQGLPVLGPHDDDVQERGPGDEEEQRDDAEGIHDARVREGGAGQAPSGPGTHPHCTGRLHPRQCWQAVLDSSGVRCDRGDDCARDHDWRQRWQGVNVLSVVHPCPYTHAALLILFFSIVWTPCTRLRASPLRAVAFPFPAVACPIDLFAT